MHYDYFVNSFNILSKTTQDIESRRKCLQLRARYFFVQEPITKIAFDTRRINQETDFNPRRNLQYYQRSEAFIDEEITGKIQQLFKVKAATDQLFQQYFGKPEWLDSYTRILHNSLEQVLRTEQKDFDFSKTQVNYLFELLFVRYRLRPEDIDSFEVDQIKQVILNRDEVLLRTAVFSLYGNGLEKNSVQSSGTLNTIPMPLVVPPPPPQDTLMDKLFNNVKASKDSPEVERTISITIKDKIVDQGIAKNSNLNSPEESKKEEALLGEIKIDG